MFGDAHQSKNIEVYIRVRPLVEREKGSEDVTSIEDKVCSRYIYIYTCMMYIYMCVCDEYIILKVI